MPPSPLILPGMTPGANGIQITDETLALVKQSIEQRSVLNRASVDTGYTGFQGYDLKGPAETVTPTEVMFSASLPRVKEGGYPVHYFHAITKLGWNGVPGVVDDGAVASEIVPTTVNLYSIVQSIAVQQSITFQEEWRTAGFMGDLKAQMMSLLLYSLKLIEENWLISGCDYLWAPPAPLPPTTTTTGGTVAAGTYFVAVSALSANGETFATIAQSNTNGVMSNATITTTGTTSTISVTAFRVPYATGYNVYVGTSPTTMYRQAAANFLGGALPGAQSGLSLIGNFTFTLTSLATSGATQPTANTAITQLSAAHPGQPLMFNGLLALIFSAGNQAYNGQSNQGGAPTSVYTAAGGSLNTVTMTGLNPMGPTILQPASTSGALALNDFYALFAGMYYNALAKPSRLAVSGYDAITLANLFQSQAGTRFVVDLSKPETLQNITYGARIGRILNPIANSVVVIEVWPYLPQGTIVALSDALPWPVPNFTGKTMEVRVNQDYRGFDFPPTAQYQKWAFADYVDETLKLNFLGGFGAITGIMPPAL
ncbi:MAG: hypothetical protein IVW57_00230 [Ktedonobacterales bacterium]|nr:hypothetical protein [Ktedonobacterales bacterium]